MSIYVCPGRKWEGSGRRAVWFGSRKTKNAYPCRRHPAQPVVESKLCNRDPTTLLCSQQSELWNGMPSYWTETPRHNHSMEDKKQTKLLKQPRKTETKHIKSDEKKNKIKTVHLIKMYLVRKMKKENHEEGAEIRKIKLCRSQNHTAEILPCYAVSIEDN